MTNMRLLFYFESNCFVSGMIPAVPAMVVMKANYYGLVVHEIYLILYRKCMVICHMLKFAESQSRAAISSVQISLSPSWDKSYTLAASFDFH